MLIKLGVFFDDAIAYISIITTDNPGSGILHKFEKAADNNLDSEDFDNDSDNFIVWIYGVLSLLGLIGAVFIIAHLVVRRKSTKTHNQL